jgi:hypothetical protein
MPLRPLDEELVQEEQKRETPEIHSRREEHIRTDELLVRECAREGVRQDAREDSRVAVTPRA